MTETLTPDEIRERARQRSWNPFQKGDRVRLSMEGIVQFTHFGDPDRIGTVARTPRHPGCVAVRWDGANTARNYAYKFLEKVE